jgi:hypothetical protein
MPTHLPHLLLSYIKKNLTPSIILHHSSPALPLSLPLGLRGSLGGEA